MSTVGTALLVALGVPLAPAALGREFTPHR